MQNDIFEIKIEIAEKDKKKILEITKHIQSIPDKKSENTNFKNCFENIFEKKIVMDFRM
jgi:hypothetical protein